MPFINLGFSSDEKWKTILAAFFLSNACGDSKYFNTISLIYEFLFIFSEDENHANNSKAVDIFSYYVITYGLSSKTFFILLLNSWTIYFIF